MAIHECIVLADAPSALLDLCGISVLERMLRTLQRCGYSSVTILSNTPEPISKSVTPPSWARADLTVNVRPREQAQARTGEIARFWPDSSKCALIIRGDLVIDSRLVRRLGDATSPTALVDSTPPSRIVPFISSVPNSTKGKLCGAAVVDQAWISTRAASFGEDLLKGIEQGSVATLDVADEPLYDPGLRRNLRPFWFRATAPGDKDSAEEILIDSVQKGTLDLPALVHAPLEAFLISHLCRTRIKPNQLTAVWAAIAALVIILFATGHLVAGVVGALVVGIIDGLDGKQARIKVETTKAGKVEHHFDSFFEVVSPCALAFYFYTSGQLPSALRYLLLLIAAEAVDGIAKAAIYSVARHNRRDSGILDRIVRFVGGRRNIYIWVLIATMIAGAPAKSLIIMAWWEIATAAMDVPRAVRGRWALGKKSAEVLKPAT